MPTSSPTTTIWPELQAALKRHGVAKLLDPSTTPTGLSLFGLPHEIESESEFATLPP